ncbi:hypothetical protein Leryth_001754 [Lithospermum erythrorhizon]|nr:hypothetical protein Leryth_001754 [Lithospermum erythrorhizon]
MSGQLPNRAGSSLPGQFPLQQQMNGNYQMSGQMQNPIRPNRGMDADLLKARRFMSQRILEFLMRRQQHSHEIPQRKMEEIIKKLEEGLFKAATTKDEYVNLTTLESRLLNLIRRPNLGNQDQQYSNVNSSSIGTMIPTPGMPQAVNSNLMGSSSVDNALIMSNNNTGASSTVSSGNFMSTSNGLNAGVIGGSLPTYDGSFSNGHQNLSSSFGSGAVGNNMGAGVERMSTQMIPTPGFSNTNNTNMENSNINNQSYQSNNAGVFSSAESSMLSLPLQQKPLASTHNGHILHNLATHMGGGIRSSLAQTSYGMLNGNFNGGVGMLGNDLHIVNGRGASEGYMQATIYGSSHKQLDQHQQPLLLEDSYGMSAADASGSENLFVPVTSVGSLENRQNLTIPKTNPTLMANQSSLHTSQPVNKLMKESVDQAERLSYPSHSSSENLIQSHQQFQQNPRQFSQQYLQPQNQQNLQNQHHQILLKNNSFAQSQTLSHIKSEPGLEHQHEALKPQASEQFQLPDIPNRFSKNSIENPSRSSQYPSISSALPNSSSQNPTSQQMQQMLHQNHFFPDTSDFVSVSGGVQSGSIMQNQWYSKSQDESSIPVNCQTELSTQKEFHQRMTGLDEAQENHLSSDASIIGQSVTNRSQEPSNVNGAVSRSNVLNRERQYKNQQRWLLFLRHARRCPAPEGKCPEPHCIIVQKLLRHIEDCNVFECSYPRCHVSKVLINHHRNCKCTNCPVCLPVKNFVAAHLKASRNDIRSSLQNSVSESGMPYVANEVSSRSTQKDNPGVDENSERLEPSLKRLNIGKSSQPLLIDSGISRERVPQQDTLPTEQHYHTGLPLKSEATEVKMEFPGVGEISPDSIEMPKGNMDGTYSQRHDTDATLLNNPTSFFQQEIINVEKEVDQVKLENNLVPPESASGSKSGKPTIKGVSLIELFTPEQVREHIRGLRQWVGQSKAKAEKNQAMEHSMSENSCQLCAVEKVTFEPPPIYCSPCGARIKKRNAMYYTIGAE